jgi:hypothetical protein
MNDAFEKKDADFISQAISKYSKKDHGQTDPDIWRYTGTGKKVRAQLRQGNIAVATRQQAAAITRTK